MSKAIPGIFVSPKDLELIHIASTCNRTWLTKTFSSDKKLYYNLAKAISAVQINFLAGAICLMDYIDKVLEKLREWAGKLIEALLGPQAEPEAELIPIPVNEPQRRRNS